ncbi:hypothetical protein BJX70DRAFT_277191 [Aspergillus crustosus]
MISSKTSGNYHIIQNIVYLCRWTSQSFFDPVLHKITTMIRSQMTAAKNECGYPVVNEIVLTGGMARSYYVYGFIRRCFDNLANCLLFITAYGSVLCGILDMKPVTYCAPLHCGIESTPSFHFLPENEATYWSNPYHYRNEPDLKTGVVSWVLTRNIEYSPEYQRSQTMHYLYTEGKPTLLAVPVYGCALDDTPESVSDSSVMLLDHIMVDFSILDLAKFPKHEISAQEIIKRQHHSGRYGRYGRPDRLREIWIIEYFIEITFSAEPDVVEFTAHIRGSHPSMTIGRLRIKMKGLVDHRNNRYLAERMA